MKVKKLIQLLSLLEDDYEITPWEYDGNRGLIIHNIYDKYIGSINFGNEVLTLDE